MDSYSRIRKKRPSTIKFFVVITILFVSIPFVCFVAWNVIFPSIGYKLYVEHGNNELGKYYMLSATDDGGIAIQWRVGYFGKWGAFTVWKWKQALEEGDNYSYILWRVTWLPLQIE
jgi:hypothetical protein